MNNICVVCTDLLVPGRTYAMTCSDRCHQSYIDKANDAKYVFWNETCSCGEPRGLHGIVEGKRLLFFRAREDGYSDFVVGNRLLSPRVQRVENRISLLKGTQCHASTSIL